MIFWGTREWRCVVCVFPRRRKVCTLKDINVILAENIFIYRKRNELTQRALADLLGVTFQAVSKWENGKSAPDISVLPVLADTLCCSIDELFSREAMLEKGDGD